MIATGRAAEDLPLSSHNIADTLFKRNNSFLNQIALPTVSALLGLNGLKGEGDKRRISENSNT